MFHENKQTNRLINSFFAIYVIVLSCALSTNDNVTEKTCSPVCYYSFYSSCLVYLVYFSSISLEHGGNALRNSILILLFCTRKKDEQKKNDGKKCYLFLFSGRIIIVNTLKVFSFFVYSRQCSFFHFNDSSNLLLLLQPLFCNNSHSFVPFKCLTLADFRCLQNGLNQSKCSLQIYHFDWFDWNLINNSPFTLV